MFFVIGAIVHVICVMYLSSLLVPSMVMPWQIKVTTVQQQCSLGSQFTFTAQTYTHTHTHAHTQTHTHNHKSLTHTHTLTHKPTHNRPLCRLAHHRGCTLLQHRRPPHHVLCVRVCAPARVRLRVCVNMCMRVCVCVCTTKGARFYNIVAPLTTYVVTM
jgi:hypothetical protein